MTAAAGDGGGNQGVSKVREREEAYELKKMPIWPANAGCNFLVFARLD